MNIASGGCIRICWYLRQMNEGNLRLEPTLSATGVATKVILGGVFSLKYISSPKYRFRECRWRGYHRMPDQLKSPLKQVHQSYKWFFKLFILIKLCTLIQ